ncbi:MAG: CHAT domain-containing protein [Kibdelosporangium sp.]
MVGSDVEQALSYLDQAQGSTDLGVIETAVDLCRAVAESVGPDHLDRPVHLHNLSLALRLRFERAGTPDDLESAIATSRHVLDVAPGGDPNLSSYRHNLGMSLWLRYRRARRPKDLAEAIGIARRGTAGGEPGRTLCLTVLGLALFSRFQLSGSKPDLDEAITLIRAAVSQPALLAHLSSALLTRFESTGDVADVDEAIAAGLTGADAFPVGHPDWVLAVSSLCTSFRVRYTHAGNQSDLDRAIGYGQAAVEALPNAMALGNLAAALRVQFEESDSLEDLDAALVFAHAAVETAAPDDPDRARYLDNLGAVLISRYRLLGDPGDLDHAIVTTRAAVSSTRTKRPLAQLETALLIRFERTGALADLDEAIAIGWEAVATSVANHSHLSTLAQALLRRHARTRAEADLDQALTLAREAHAGAPLTDRPAVSDVVGHVLLTRYSRTGSAADLDAAISAFRGAASPFLVSALHERFRLRGNPADLAEAIELGEEAVRAGRVAAMSDLALILPDSDEAIAFGRAAVHATPPNDPALAKRLTVLGHILQDAGDLNEAFTRFVEAASVPLADPSTVVDACWSAGSLIAASSPGRAANLLETAVRAAAESPAQHIELVREAASLALAAGSPNRALSLLELGRGVQLSQALGSRGDVVDLRAEHPELARQFMDLRDQLSLPDDPLSPGNHARDVLFDALGQTMAAIRALPGFSTFLLPVEVDVAVAGEGPLAVINVTRWRSDAILVTPHGISSVALPRLTPRALSARIQAFYTAVESSNQDALHGVLEWLWDTAASPILSALGFTDTPRGDWPRMWWVTSGPLSLLPLHAAGYHYAQGSSVMDRVISSYTPTIRALEHARGRALPTAVSNALVVATSPDAAAEADAVHSRVPGSIVLSPGTPLPHRPTRGNVLSQLDNHPIVHFTCPGDGLGRLHLADAPLRIASLVPIQLTQARLAYLSACDTPSLTDEPTHLPTAVQLAGYPHVIGTLWAVTDSVTSFIAADFYSGLTSTTEAARALHQAIRGIRTDVPHLPAMWAGYLYTGA